MLGLFYLQERMKFEKGDLSSSQSLMRMLTTCLLLGSKFLDDNTFQNRSWAEVSNIPVTELNVMELDWLKDFNWEIHNLMYDNDQGFFMWVDHWHSYEEKAQAAQAKTAHKLAPINTNISRHSVHQPLMSPDGPIPPQYQHATHYDTAWSRPHVSEYSPPSTHYSGPTTPEYYSTNWHYPTIADNCSTARWNALAKSTRSYQQHAQFSPYYPPHYGQGNHLTAWSPHEPHCRCLSCNKQVPEYYMPRGYPVQSVVG